MIKKLIWRFFQSESGATAIEYGLIAAFISLAVAISIFAFGDTLNQLFFVGLVDMLGP